MMTINTFHGKVSLLLTLAIIFNGAFTLLSYFRLQNEVVIDTTKIMMPLSYETISPMTTRMEQFQILNLNQTINATTVWLAGIILDVLKIQQYVWESIIELNCNNRLGVHIIAKDNIDRGREKVNRMYNSLGYNDCAPLEIHSENNLHIDLDAIGDNRIDRISYLRDYQRQMLKEQKYANQSYTGTIVLVDLDLFQLPSSELIIDQIEKLNNINYPFDAVCAIGSSINLSKAERNKKSRLIPFYYDTYATVFIQDTFSHPLSRRLIPHLYEGEDRRLVRSNDQLNGNFTQADIWNYFVHKGMQSETGNVPVKSCFGGLAMYRQREYFNHECKYTLTKDVIDNHKSDQTSIMRYASKKDERPCEHVVFHDCLKTSKTSFQIALNPKLITLWRRDS